MPVSNNPTQRSRGNDPSRQGLNRLPFEGNNPAWQSNSKVGSRYRVEHNKAAFTWKLKSQGGLSSNEIVELPVLGSRGDFNKKPISKIVVDPASPNDPIIHHLHARQRKIRYKSEKASAGALRRNNWVIYVQTALTSANLDLITPLKYPEVISDIILQGMYHAEEGDVPTPINPLMYRLFNPRQSPRLVAEVAQELQANRNYFTVNRRLIPPKWNEFCNSKKIDPTPGLEPWGRFTDHSGDLNSFIQDRQQMILDQSIFNPSQRQIPRVIAPPVMPGAVGVILPPPSLQSTSVTSKRKRNVTQDEEDEEDETAFILASDYPVSPQSAPSTSSQPLPPSPTPVSNERLLIAKMISDIPDGVEAKFYSPGSKTAVYTEAITDVKACFSRWLNFEAFEANTLNSMAASLFAFYQFTRVIRKDSDKRPDASFIAPAFLTSTDCEGYKEILNKNKVFMIYKHTGEWFSILYCLGLNTAIVDKKLTPYTPTFHLYHFISSGQTTTDHILNTFINQIKICFSDIFDLPTNVKILVQTFNFPPRKLWQSVLYNFYRLLDGHSIEKNTQISEFHLTLFVRNLLSIVLYMGHLSTDQGEYNPLLSIAEDLRDTEIRYNRKKILQERYIFQKRASATIPTNTSVQPKTKLNLQKAQPMQTTMSTIGKNSGGELKTVQHSEKKKKQTATIIASPQTNPTITTQRKSNRHIKKPSRFRLGG